MDRTAPDTNYLFQSESIFRDSVTILISSHGKAHSILELKDKTGFMMISVKNKSFSNRIIEQFCDFSDAHLNKSHITIVDTPYINNIYATHDEEGLQQREIDKLRTISEQSHRRIERILGKRKCSNISLISWRELEQKTPNWMIDEVDHAFAQRGRLHRDILARTRQVLPLCMDDEQLEKYAQFMVQEIPTLCYLYYLFDKKTQVVDVYPGEQPDFLWDIESGHYADELPRISEITHHHSGLIYLDFRLRDLHSVSAA